jgi:PAS domain S-box-containing protein
MTRPQRRQKKRPGSATAGAAAAHDRATDCPAGSAHAPPPAAQPAPPHVKALEDELQRQSDALGEARRQLERSRQYLQAFLDAIPDVTIVVAPDCRILLANRAARDLIGGRDPVEVCLGCYELLHRSEEPCHRLSAPCPLKEVIRTKTPVTATHEHYDAEGEKVFVELTAWPIFDETGEVVQVIESCRDVTARKQAEHALRESEELFRQMAESIADVVWLSTPGMTGVLYANSAYEKVWGRSRRSLQESPLSFLEAVHAEDHGRVLAALSGHARGEWSHEYRIVRPDGEVRWIRDRGFPIRNSRGDIVRMVGVATDVTEQKRAAEQIAQLAKFPDENPNPVLRVSGGGTVLYGNRAGRPLLELWQCREGAPLPDRWRALAADALRAAATRQAELECDGRVFALTFAPVVEWNYVNVYGLDITDRKRAEQALRAERDRAQSYLNLSGTIFVAIGADQNVTLINRKGCETLGRSEEDIVGSNWFDRFVPQRHRERVKAAFVKLMAGQIEPVEYFENPIVTAGGEERTVAWHNALLTDDEGRIVGTLSSGSDITDQRRCSAP